MDWTPTTDPAARRRFRVAVAAAYVCFGVNLLASLGAAIFLEPGSTMHPLDERSKYVLEHGRDWRWTWAIWMAAAPSLVAFYAAFAWTLADDLALAKWAAVAIAAVGSTFDVYAEVLLAFELPTLYKTLPPGTSERALLLLKDAEAVLRLEGRATLLTGALANGLYTLAGAMIAACAAQTAGFPRWLAWASAPAWLLGAALSASCLLFWPRATAVAMAGTMGAFLLWLALVIVFLWRRAAGAVDTPPKPG